jgi:hypothetical protein
MALALNYKAQDEVCGLLYLLLSPLSPLITSITFYHPFSFDHLPDTLPSLLKVTNTVQFRQRVRDTHSEIGKLVLETDGAESYAKIPKRLLEHTKHYLSKLRLRHRALTAWQDAKRLLIELQPPTGASEFVTQLQSIPSQLEQADDVLEATVTTLETSLRLIPATT